MPTQSNHPAVLFADVADSTALYRRLGDVAALGVVSSSLNAMKTVLPHHQGRLVKTLGDAVMCIFPGAECAVAAAIDMQRAIGDLRPGGVTVQIRVGLHMGPVVIGDDDVYGDTVNVAAYLADAATPDQILVAEQTLVALSTERRDAVRPIFDAILKTTLARTAVFEILWRDDAVERTQINMQVTRMIPQDAGSLLLVLDGQEHRVDYWHPTLTIGREAGCDLKIADKLISRRHATIRVERTQFYLVDHSINGTFVTRENGGEIHVVRREILLEGVGEIRPGYARDMRAGPFVAFSRDRRSIYRV